MQTEIQAHYERRLDRYASLLHGNEPPGLAPKLALYSSLLKQRERYGHRFLFIEPLLLPLTHAAEVDLHLATAKLLERPERSQRSLFSFLDFCLKNRMDICWQTGVPSQVKLEEQRDALEAHRSTINAIMGRRDKFFAHLDNRYFEDPRAIFEDFPLNEGEVISLVNLMIHIISEHQCSLRGGANFHVSEFYEIAVENMIRNLESGRRVNFPGQLEERPLVSRECDSGDHY